MDNNEFFNPQSAFEAIESELATISTLTDSNLNIEYSSPTNDSLGMFNQLLQSASDVSLCNRNNLSNDSGLEKDVQYVSSNDYPMKITNQVRSPIIDSISKFSVESLLMPSNDTHNSDVKYQPPDNLFAVSNSTIGAMTSSDKIYTNADTIVDNAYHSQERLNFVPQNNSISEAKEIENEIDSKLSIIETDISRNVQQKNASPRKIVSNDFAWESEISETISEIQKIADFGRSVVDEHYNYLSTGYENLQNSINNKFKGMEDCNSCIEEDLIVPQDLDKMLDITENISILAGSEMKQSNHENYQHHCVAAEKNNELSEPEINFRVSEEANCLDTDNNKAAVPINNDADSQTVQATAFLENESLIPQNNNTTGVSQIKLSVNAVIQKSSNLDVKNNLLSETGITEEKDTKNNKVNEQQKFDNVDFNNSTLKIQDEICCESNPETCVVAKTQTNVNMEALNSEFQFVDEKPNIEGIVFQESAQAADYEFKTISSDENKLEDSRVKIENEQGDSQECIVSYDVPAFGDSFDQSDDEMAGRKREIEEEVELKPEPLDMEYVHQDIDIKSEDNVMEQRVSSENLISAHSTTICTSNQPEVTHTVVMEIVHGSQIPMIADPNECILPNEGEENQLAHDPHLQYETPTFDLNSITSNMLSLEQEAYGLLEPKQRKLFKCPKCKNVFSSDNGFSNHLRKHDWKTKGKDEITDVYICPQCCQKYSDASEFFTHITTHDWQVKDEKRYQCTFCDKKFTYPHNLRQHLEMHHGIVRNKNGALKGLKTKGELFNCNGSFKTCFNDLEPEKLTVDQEIYSCEDCLKSFRSSKRLKLHKRLGCSGLSHKCSLCIHSFASKKKLMEHLQSHYFHCTTCYRRFNNEGSYLKHVEICESLAHKCSTCHASFATLAKLKNHLASHGFTCKICFKKFKSKLSFNKHLAKHGDVKDTVAKWAFQCKICDRTFKYESSYKKHIQHHESKLGNPDVKPRRSLKDEDDEMDNDADEDEEFKYVCVCGVKYQRKSRLETCLRSHIPTPERENCYACSVCTKTFQHRAELDLHKRTHSKKKFSCKFCPTDYHTQDELIDHLKVHKKVQLMEFKVINEIVEGKGRIKCFICNAKFVDLKDLKTHVVSNHNEPLTCRKCKKSFAKIVDFASHTKSAHPEVKGKSVLDVLEAFTELAKAWKCEECDLQFEDPDKLVLHEREQHSPKKLGSEELFQNQCEICRRLFINQKQLHNHRRKHHDIVEPEPEFEEKSEIQNGPLCIHCRKICKDESALASHLRLHSTDRKYPCKFCDFRFATLEKRKSHESIHTGDMKYVCFICEYRCSSYNRLIRHKESQKHINTKEALQNPAADGTSSNAIPIANRQDSVDSKTCDVCGQKFSSEEEMGEHKETHPFIEFPNEDTPTRIFFK